MRLKRARAQTACLAWVALATACAPEPPHLVLVTADTLRPDHLSAAGYPRATSPRIDAFAASAWNFTEALSVIPKTAPAFTTVFTGLHPREHGVRSNFAHVPDGAPTLAERLRDAGYRTVAYVANPALRGHRGFDRGFDVYQLLPDQDERVTHAFRDLAAEPWRQPTFVWLHYLDPHGPYAPRPALERLFLDDEHGGEPGRVRATPPDASRPNKVLGALPFYHQRADGEDRVARFVARYDAEIRGVDAAFGRVLDLLREAGHADDTAIVFTSDHGESLGEHDYYFEHGWFAYDPGLRIPLLLRTPGQREGRTVETPVSIQDLLPTLLGLAGLDCVCEGVDLLRNPPRDGPILVENADAYPEKFIGARDARWKYLRRERDGREELYDLRDDPGETRNVADAHPDVRARLADFVKRERARLEARALTAPDGAADDPATIRRLRELGYVE